MANMQATCRVTAAISHDKQDRDIPLILDSTDDHHQRNFIARNRLEQTKFSFFTDCQTGQKFVAVLIEVSLEDGRPSRYKVDTGQH